MKQLTQNLGNGEMNIVEVPIPALKKGEVLISTNLSLISKGTEKMLVDFGKANLYEKAKLQPDKVKDVIEKIKSEGFYNTYEAVQSKLNDPIPLGYSNVGRVIEIGEKVEGIKIGDRVISNGSHAEVVAVPQNLCAKIPDNVSDEDASFTVIGAIALQGIRLANPTLGETVVVLGLGLIGLMTIQLLKASGCKVIGLDMDMTKVKLANKLGIIANQINDNVDPLNWCLNQNEGNHVDSTLITASTKSSSPIELAAKLSRKRGKIILVGVSGLNFKRELFYKKELSFQVSCSYGPGRYDPVYENYNDYPIGFVRWTAKRNFEAVLNAFANDQISAKRLISNKFPFEKFNDAFNTLLNESSTLGILLSYKQKKSLSQKIFVGTINKNIHTKKSKLNVSFIGAGNYSKRKLIPIFSKNRANFIGIAASSGLNPSIIARKYNFKYASTNVREIIEDQDNEIIVIASRHDSHAKLIVEGLRAKKHIFVEKPLCLTIEELRTIKEAYTGEQILMVGYNRRFAPLTLELKKFLDKNKLPMAFNYTCNAGFIDKKHWLNNKKIGGGRLLGEACHFIDLLRFLANSSIESISINYLKDSNNLKDTFIINLSFKDGSIGTINYLSNGSKAFQKERLEVFVNRGIIRIDDFKKISSWGIDGFKNHSNLVQDKGQNNCVISFMNSVSKGIPSPISIEQLFEVQEKLLELV